MATILHPTHYLHILNCLCPDHGSLAHTDGKVVCRRCNRTFSIRHNILEFINMAELDAHKLRELQGNTYELTQETIERMASKDMWSEYYSHFSEKKIQYLLRYLDRIKCNQIFSLGSGTGYELKKLLSLKKFDTVYSSDLSYTALRIVPYTIEQFDVKVGLFTSDLEYCPIKCKDVPVLIYEALHHTNDLHFTIEQLLIRNYHQILFVEPTSNFVIRYLARKGLAQREEYSGLKPKWLELNKLHKLCRKHGYKAFVTTIWEIPEDYFRKLCKRENIAQKIFLFLIDIISLSTNLLNFGSFSIVYLKKI